MAHRPDRSKNRIRLKKLSLNLLNYGQPRLGNSVFLHLIQQVRPGKFPIPGRLAPVYFRFF